MLTVDEALARLLAGVRETDGERVALAEALNRVPVAATLASDVDVPPFANSAMDGYAVRAADGDGARRLVGESRAGGPPAPAVGAATAVRIMTGAPMPAGADAVVPIEEAEESDGSVLVRSAPSVGRHVREAGLDVRRGSSVTLPRLPLTPSAIGL
ncbi:MAG: hypothetical protein ACRDE6_08225, partial [Candidatus Limnocylindria bacterium]